MTALEALCKQTGTTPDEWEAIDGPETGVGVEYWFRHGDGREAYVCDDQGEIRVDVK